MPRANLAPTRRGLAQVGLLATIAASGAAVAPAQVLPSSQALFSLGAELDVVHRDRAAHLALHPYGQGDPFYDRHWELREMINAVPAQNQDELRVKARAAEYAYEHDPTAECHVAGSFRELSRSLIADILRLQTSAA